MRFLTHLTALTALFYAWRSARILEGWIRIPLVESTDDGVTLSIVVPARDEERNI
jgi:hypothetical protein